jgi:hypothetical protein
MMTTNQFLRQNSSMDDGKGGKTAPTADYMYALRTSYEGLPKKLKKAMDSPYIREKNKMNFADWWALISYNITEGKKSHKQTSEQQLMESKLIQNHVRNLDSDRTKRMLKLI